MTKGGERAEETRGANPKSICKEEKQMKKTLIVLCVLLLAVSLIAVGAKKKEKAPRLEGSGPKAGETLDQTAVRVAKELAKGKDITLHVLLTWDAPGTALTKVIPMWEEATGIKVKTEPLSTLEMEQKVNLELSSGSPEYDIIQYDNYIRKPVVENPNVLNLDPYLKKYDYHFETLVNPKAEFWAVADDGTHRALPFYWCNYVLAYRKDLIDNPKEKAAFKKKYGYDYDIANLAWDKSYKDLAAFFTRDTNKDGKVDLWGTAEMFAPYAAGDTFMIRYINYWKAGKPYIFDVKSGKCTLNDQYTLDVFKDLMDVVKAGDMIPEILQTDWASILGTFGSGRCAMAHQYAPTWMPLQSPSSDFVCSGPDKVGYTQVPGMKGVPKASIDSGWISFITKNSKLPEIAYLFILWSASDKVDKAMAMTTLHNPIRAATYKDAEVIKANPIFEAMFLNPNFVGVPGLLIYAETQLIISNAMQALVNGDVDIKGAQGRIVSEIEAKWAEVTQK
jgi:multiple sugar transport system substrate-binding protein